ncbi:GvpL/GvpF family gas vesicle protein [Streptomyces sp. MS06]|uniref:GvpL/GvpF family gas vesicle protein n=1 Tax=Streptomyces sp. MS06 TaxID=3385974 RepID=UPI00399F2998
MTGARYVYAVCRPFDTPLQSQLTGVAGAPPRRLAHRGLVAVHSEVPERDFAEEALRARLADPDRLDATVRAHRNVVDALTVVTTPLPLRPGTVFRDDSGLRSMVEEREAPFRRELARLDGRVEWAVRVRIEQPAPPGTRGRRDSPAVPHSRPGGDGPPPGRTPAAVRENPRRNAEEFAGRLHGMLTAFSEDFRGRFQERAGPPGAAGWNVLDAAYLVPRTRCGAFVAEVERARAEAPGLRVELDGPRAAYSFVAADAAG